jgi:hypothetical protein
MTAFAKPLRNTTASQSDLEKRVALPSRAFSREGGDFELADFELADFEFVDS